MSRSSISILNSQFSIPKGNHMSPRWRKVLRDLLNNKTRTALLVLSIAVGVFAVVMIASSRVIMLRDLAIGWFATNPASASLDTESFDDELVQAIRRMPEVGDAEARRIINVRAQVGPDEWKDLKLMALPDYEDMRIYKMRPLS